MNDRENVIKGVHDARRYLEDREWVDKSVGVHIDALNDALDLLKEQEHKDKMYHALEEDWKRIKELLKEQEAVKPTWSRGKPFCGACGLRIHGGKFCSECGKPILWEGR